MELLCIQTHSQGYVKAGSTYTLIDKAVKCCNKVLFDVGVRSLIPLSDCSICGKSYHNDGIVFCSPSLFAQIGTKDENECYEEKQLIER